MARRTTTKTPEQEEEYFPGLTIKRQKLKDAIATLQGRAFDARIELVVAEVGIGKEVQIAIGEGRVRMVKKEDHLEDLENSIKNAQRGCAALTKLLDGLPEVDDEPDITPDDGESKD